MDSPRPARILLGVTGSIAAYKCPDLVRRLRDRGAEVQVVLTAGAAHFVTALTFQAVSGRPVREALWDTAAEAAMGHIELARWADLVLVAPASAGFLARLAHGLADDLLSTLCLATGAPILVAPAMNHQMWANAATAENVERLRARGIAIAGPGSGDQACGEFGEGRMLESGEIAAAAMARLSIPRPWAGVKVVVSAGPTRERLDPVRFLGNRSSGKMGYAIAAAARDAGAAVVLVSGPVAIAPPADVAVVNVESAREMHDAVHRAIAGADIYIGAAAVADYAPAAVAPKKIKKRAEGLELKLERTPDILASIAQLASGRPFVVGFAAETENVEENARAKLMRKGADVIAANLVGDDLGFERDDNALVVLWRGGREEIASAPKTELARRLVELVARLRGEARRAGRVAAVPG